MAPANAITILDGLDRDEIRERLGRRWGPREFFWVDLTVPGEASMEDVADAFGLDDDAAVALGTFGRREIAHRDAPRRVHIDDEHVVFPFWCVANPEAGIGEDLRLIEVNVLVHGDYLLTAHRDEFDLRDLVGTQLPRGRSERYAVYVVLAAMTASFFRALLVLQEEMGRLEADLFESRGHGGPSPRARIRDARLRLTRLRSVVGPEQVLFERAGEEIDQVGGLEGDHRDYFERINKQLDRILEGIDAASQGLSSAVDVQLNETSYRLTILATIFLPLTFITGFFGMNFDWMVGEISSEKAFWIWGVGGVAAAALLISAFLVWQGVLSARPWEGGRRRRRGSRPISDG
jgi:magnesium transporter